MRKRRRSIAGLLAVIIMILAADVWLLYLTGMPRLEHEVMQKEWNGLDLLKKYQENTDMIGWLQVEGTAINYPVMRGEYYLCRNFNCESDASGSLFVEDDWTDEDLCTLIYGHNMWMYGTMLNPLHQFVDGDFFYENRDVKFYVIKDGGLCAEKRTYEIICCVRTSVDAWNYSSCQYICAKEDLDLFLDACRSRAVQKTDTGFESEEAIVLSTCSYHIEGSKGRLLLVGSLRSRNEQKRIDPQKDTRIDLKQKTN